MSALRLSRPGQPTVLLDMGPAVARYHGASGGPLRVIGGTTRLVADVDRASLRTPETASSKAARLKREGKA